MPLNEQSCLTYFVNDSQKNEFIRLFSGIIVGPASLSAFFEQNLSPSNFDRNCDFSLGRCVHAITNKNLNANSLRKIPTSCKQ